LTLTPPAAASGRSVLASLAATAARQPAPAVHRYRYRHTQLWSWLDQVHDGPSVDFPRYSVFTAWEDAQGRGRSVTVQRTRDGFTTARARSIFAVPRLPPLDVSQARLGRELHLGSGFSDNAGAQFDAVSGYLLEAITPADEAKLLRLLAQDPGTVNDGTTTDRAGRLGVAVSATSPSLAGQPSQRWTLVFDRATGRLLEADDTLESPGGAIDVPVGGLIDYSVSLGTGWVSKIGQAPPAPPAATG
jgi:hypothetical protein